MQESITLHQTMLDWLTVTTFDQETFYTWIEHIKHTDGIKNRRQSKRLQYVGEAADGDGGVIFAGMAHQRGARHYMLQVSGELSDFMLPMIYPHLRTGTARVTRLDIQVTIPEPKGWGQWELFNRLKRAGKNMGWVESEAKAKGQKTTKLSTVYVNSRTSQRFARIYEKMTAGWVKLLRLEVENKGDVARAIAKRLCDAQPDQRQEIKRAEVLSFAQKDDKLHLIFSEVLSTAVKPVRVKSASGNTKRWILDTCFPAIRRYLNEHGNEGQDEIIQELVLTLAAYQGIDSKDVSV